MQLFESNYTTLPGINAVKDIQNHPTFNAIGYGALTLTFSKNEQLHKCVSIARRIESNAHLFIKHDEPELYDHINKLRNQLSNILTDPQTDLNLYNK